MTTTAPPVRGPARRGPKERSRFNVEVKKSRITRKSLMNLSRQLAAFLRAGIPLLDAISVLAQEADKPAVRRVMTEIASALRSGSRFSDAVDRHPKDFPPFYRGILRSAELTGRLDTVLEQLHGYLERDLEAGRKIKGAMIYPAVIAVMALVAVAILSVAVLPKFVTFFEDLGTELPLATRLLLDGSGFVATWWWALFGGLAVIVACYLLAMRLPPVRRTRDALLLKVPVLGPTIRYAQVERFTRLLGSMVAAGVPLPEAMAVATGSLRNMLFRRGLARARQELLDGAGLAGPIAATGLFPGVANQMIRVGEETGTLDAQLEVAASYYAQELDYRIKNLTTLIEPTVMVVMGLVVGFVAVALVQAMYNGFGGIET
jgi:type IV pilus assembly protein PilC